MSAPEKVSAARKEARRVKQHRDEAEAIVATLRRLTDASKALSAVNAGHAADVKLRHAASTFALIEAEAEQLVDWLDFHVSALHEAGETFGPEDVACLACGRPAQSNPPDGCCLARCRAER